MRQVTVEDMMNARERRQAAQSELTRQYGAPLCCLTLNIPGPVKQSPWIECAFDEGLRLLRASFARRGIGILAQRETRAFTGCEALWALKGDGRAAKEIGCGLEDMNAFGRLLDIDVLLPNGGKLSRTDIGLPARRCMLCENEAALCARSRAHGWQEVFAWAQGAAEAYFRERWEEHIASLACRALLYELCATPKPGLVDRANNGSHRDMDCFSFSASASALFPYFRRCAREGLSGKPALARLRQLGLLAEDDMLRATGGVNTHKGAIFSLGLLCAAAGREARSAPLSGERLLARVGEAMGPELNRELEALSPESARTAGERQYVQGGLRGARGEAADGFPSVRKTALPRLKGELAAGQSLNDAAVYTLLALVSVCGDSNMVKRSCEKRALAARAQAGEALRRHTLCAVQALDEQFIRENLSPGGSADLLAATLFAYLWESQTDPPPPYPAPIPADTAYNG